MSNLIDNIEGSILDNSISSWSNEEVVSKFRGLIREYYHVQANHKNMVDRCALLSQREDLPVDRIPAYEELVRLQEMESTLKVIIQALKQQVMLLQRAESPTPIMPMTRGG